MAIPSPGYWYVNFGDGSTTGYYALTKWATGTVTAVGAIVRQNAAPAVGSERVFICVVAGTTHATTEPTWVLTKGAKTTDNTVTWQECTGQAALNGSLTYTSGWTSGPGGVGTGVKNQAVALGYIIANDAGANYQICTTAGTAGNGAQPSFSSTAGTTTADNTITWTSLGVVGNFTTAFGAPFARLQTAFTATWGAAGDIFWVANNNAETDSAASIQLASPGTALLPCAVNSVDSTKTSPGTNDLVAGASISRTGNFRVDIKNGYASWYGITFNSGSAGNGPNPFYGSDGNALAGHYWTSCTFALVGTGSGGTMEFGCVGTTNNGGIFKLTSCLFVFAATGQSMTSEGGTVIWNSCTFAGSGSVPTTLFKQPVVAGVGFFAGGDFSTFGSGKTLVGAATRQSRLYFDACKLGASVTFAATPTAPGFYVSFTRCDSGATGYFQALFLYEGTLTQETTIVRSGGASDGTTPLSWKIVSTANVAWPHPFESFPIAIWNDTTGSSVTATVEIVASASLNNDDVWMKVEYLGSSSTPQASFANSTKANNLATGTANTSSTATWASSPGTAMKMSVSFTPQMKGYIYVRIYVAKDSQTLYVDPVITLS